MSLSPFNRNLAYVFVTLMFLVFAVASYFFVYIPHNEKMLQEQRFRTLQNVVTNVHNRIDNSKALLEKMVASPEMAKLTSYIQQQNELGIFTIGKESLGKDSVARLQQEGTTVTVDNSRQLLRIVAVQQDSSRKETVTPALTLSMTYNLEQFIKSLLPTDVFDEYIVFNNGFALYESFPSGIYNADTDSLLLLNNHVGGSVVRIIPLAGKEYKVFLQPVFLGTGKNLIIAGLLTGSRYQYERTQLPAQGLMFLVTLVIILIITFPWIKLYQMGGKDRLTLSDGVGSVVVSMLLMSMLFFVFFKYNSRLRPKLNPNGIAILSNEIVKRFEGEVDSTYHLLRSLDSLRTNAGLTANLSNLGNNNYSYKADTAGRKAALSWLQQQAGKTAIRQVYWLDKNGEESTNWTSGDVNPDRSNYSQRNYFRKIVQQQRYFLKDAATSYYLDQLVSWTSGVFTSVISIPSGYAPGSVAAMSFSFKCFSNTVLPAGYMYAVIDGSGQVLYHSQPSRNLNENMLHELSGNKTLASIMQAHSEGFFMTEYFGKSYFVKASPLSNLPYFLVLMEDAVYIQTRDVEIYSFTFSMLLLFFSFLILQLVITFLVSARRSFFKKQLYDTSWIGPKNSLNKEYMLCALANTIIIGLLAFFFNRTTFLQYLFILLFTGSFIVLFLNSLLAKRYYDQEKVNNYKYKRIAICWLLLLMLVINITAAVSLDSSHYGSFILFQLLAFGFGAGLYFGADKLEALITRLPVTLNGKWNYVHSFSLMVLTRLIITSGIPVAFFYITAYNFEQNINQRYKLLVYSDSLMQRSDRLAIPLTDSEKVWKNIPGVYIDSVWLRNDPEIVREPLPDSTPWPTHEEALTFQLLRMFRLSVSEQATRSNYLYNTQPADASIVFNNMPLSTCEIDGVEMTKLIRSSGLYLHLSSYGINYHMPSVIPQKRGDFLNGLLFWILLLCMLALFFIIIKNIIKKLFALNLPDLKVWKKLDDKIIVNNELNKLLFIIGLPGAGKLENIKKKIKAKYISFGDNEPLILDPLHPGRSNVFVADLVNIPDSSDNEEDNAEWKGVMEKVFDARNRLIIVNHFEYNIQDERTNSIKLNFLEKLMLENKCKIIILSTIHPVAFLDSVNDRRHPVKNDKEPRHDLERWHVLLGHYRIAIMPLPEQETVYGQQSWQQLICRETKYTHFLHAMQETTLEMVGNPPQQEAITRTDELAFKLQVTAHYFYMYIWQSLTKEEKYLLYDLAEDNLVNSYDDYNLSMLIGKGLLVHSDGTLVLFNKGFRNFILSAIGNTEAMKIQERMKDDGNWSKLRAPMIIVIAAILGFLLLSQQEAYAQVVTYLTALTAGVPLVLKLFSAFDKSSQKSSS